MALQNLGRWSVPAVPAAGSPWGWPAVVTAVAGTGTALGLLRLLLGLWTIRHGWHRSKPVEEPSLLRLVEELRFALGVKQSVTVRASADLTTAATVGWRKPLLLLPDDWPDWTDEQRRAVVAHELAHIGRGDFAAWLLAQLSVALHFWHPLVRALAGRLQLQQELAADATAARLAGGRPVYLRALAELALRSDGRAHGWPAPALLSRKGTLLRRIEMLRIREKGMDRLESPIGRRLTIGLVITLTLAASALRGPVQETLAGPPADAGSPVAKVAPFDLSLVGQGDDQEVDGVYGVRPAAILNRPGTRPTLQLLNTQIDVLTASFKAGGVGIHVEDVEQLMGRVYFKGVNKQGKRSLNLSLIVLRTTRDMDWAKLRDQCGPNLKQHQWKGETYISSLLSPLLMAITGGNGDCYIWAADSRTLIFDSENAIKAQIEAKVGGTRPAAPAYAAGWNRVSQGLFALALDNRSQRLINRTVTEEERKEALANPNKPEYHLTRFYQNVSRVVIGFAGDDDFRFDLLGSAETPSAAAEMVQNCEALSAAAKKMVAQDKTEAKDSDQAEALALGLFQKALDRAAVRRDGTVVTVHAGADSGLNTLLSQYAKQLAPDK